MVIAKSSTKKMEVGNSCFQDSKVVDSSSKWYTSKYGSGGGGLH